MYFFGCIFSRFRIFMFAFILCILSTRADGLAVVCCAVVRICSSSGHWCKWQLISFISLYFQYIIRTFVLRRCSPAVDPLFAFCNWLFITRKMVVYAELIMMVLVIYIRVGTTELSTCTQLNDNFFHVYSWWGLLCTRTLDNPALHIGLCKIWEYVDAKKVTCTP